MLSSWRNFDVCVVGAGAGGASAAHALSAKGLRVALIDPKGECGASFKAEKLEPDQITLLKELNLWQFVQPGSLPIKGVSVYMDGRLRENVGIEQVGLRYEDFVNRLLTSLPLEVERFRGSVVKISGYLGARRLELSDGTCISGKLVVLASGANATISRGVGLKRSTLRNNHTLVFGFDLEISGSGLQERGLNFYPKEGNLGVGYLTIFPVPGAARANLFAYFDVNSDWVRSMKGEPAVCLDRTFPFVRRVLGDYKISGNVSAASINLWTSVPETAADVIAIGDAFQSVCPATGTGVSKVLNDVAVLSSLIDARIDLAEQSVASIAHGYYGSVRKQGVDARSLSRATNLRRLATLPGLGGALRRRGLRYPKAVPALRAAIKTAIRKVRDANPMPKIGGRYRA